MRSFVALSLVAVGEVLAEGEYLCLLEQPGYHIIEDTNCGLKLWKASKKGDRARTVDFKALYGNCDKPRYFDTLRGEIERVLDVRPREEYQQPVRYFTPQGRVVSDYGDYDTTFFLIEGGQWQWPPVRHEFRQTATVFDRKLNEPREVTLVTKALTPPIFFVSGLISGDEADELIVYAKPKFKQSDVIKMDNDLDGDTRKFYNAHDDAANLKYYSQNDALIMERHYGHYDRMLTLFWYLNDVEEGGETNFPIADGEPWPGSMASCNQGLKVKPERGAAVLWYNMDATGLVSRNALHGACKVLKGQKYAINAWVYNKPRGQERAKWDPKHPRMIALGRGDDKSVPDDGKRELAIHTDADVKIYWVDKKKPLGEQEAWIMDIDGVVPNEGDGTKQRSMNTHKSHSFAARLKLAGGEAGAVVGEYSVSNKHRTKGLRWDIITKGDLAAAPKKDAAGAEMEKHGDGATGEEEDAEGYDDEDAEEGSPSDDEEPDSDM
eukprot:g9887.t1